MKTKAVPLLVAIVGGSGAGKSWLADRLKAMLGGQAARMSLDDFYLDRSHLLPERRARLNYDHPRAIDWRLLEEVLEDCLAGRMTRLPQYDFKSHTRHAFTQVLQPVPVILMDGLWLLHRPKLRRIFGLSIFIECPTKTRLSRRLARDLNLRGRTDASVQRQFWETVEPMHQQHVNPQAGRAEIQLKSPVTAGDVHRIVEMLEARLNNQRSST